MTSSDTEQSSPYPAMICHSIHGTPNLRQMYMADDKSTSEDSADNISRSTDTNSQCIRRPSTENNTDEIYTSSMAISTTHLSFQDMHMQLSHVTPAHSSDSSAAMLYTFMDSSRAFYYFCNAGNCEEHDEESIHDLADECINGGISVEFVLSVLVNRQSDEPQIAQKLLEYVNAGMITLDRANILDDSSFLRMFAIV